MTKDEINEYLFQHLFDHQLTVLDYMTPDGMMKVIDAMRAKFQPLHFYVDDQWVRSVGGFKVSFTDAGHHSVNAIGDNLPEAVAQAAVAFLKEAKNDE